MAFPLYHLTMCQIYVLYFQPQFSWHQSVRLFSLFQAGLVTSCTSRDQSWLRAVFVHNPFQQIIHPLNNSSLDHLCLEHRVSNSLLKWKQKKKCNECPPPTSTTCIILQARIHSIPYTCQNPTHTLRSRSNLISFTSLF